MDDFKTEMLTFLTKWWAWFCYVFIGIIAKFGYDLMRKRKLSVWQAIGSILVSCFVGYLACVYFVANHPEEAPFAVPIATILGEKIVVYLMALDWKPFITNFVEFFRPKP